MGLLLKGQNPKKRSPSREGAVHADKGLCLREGEETRP